MTQTVNAFPNPALLTEGMDNCVLLAPLTSSSALGGAGAVGALAQAHFVSANPAIGNFNFDPVLGMTQGALAQAIQYSMTNATLQNTFVNYTLSLTIDRTFYTSTSDHYLFSITAAGGGGSALFYEMAGVNGKHSYQEGGVDSATLNPNIYTYQENKSAQIQQVLVGNSTRYKVYIDGLEIISGPRVFVPTFWEKCYVGSLTTLTTGITTNHLNNFVLQNRTIALPPSRIKSIAFLGTSYYALSSVPSQLFSPNNYIDWMPRGRSGGTGYTIGDTLTPVGTANGGGTGGTITVRLIDINGAIVASTCTGGTTYQPGSIVTGVTGGTGTGARFIIAAVVTGTGAMAATYAANPFGYVGSTGNGYGVGNTLTPAGFALDGGVSAGVGSGGTITVSTIDGSGNILTATATGGINYTLGMVISSVTGGAGSGARFEVNGVLAGVLTSVIPLYGGGGLFSSNGYSMNSSDAVALTVYSRGDTSALCQMTRALYKAGQYPVLNAHRSEAGATLPQIIGTTAATGRTYLCGFEAMKTADNVHPDEAHITCGANEAVSGGTDYTNFDPNYKTLLANLNADGCQLAVIDEVVSLNNNPTYAADPTIEDRVQAENIIINALPAWAASQGFSMKVAVNKIWATFGGSTPYANLFRTNDIHPNAIGSSLMGYTNGQTTVAALSATSARGIMSFPLS